VCPKRLPAGLGRRRVGVKIFLSLVIVVPFCAVLASACHRNPDNTPAQNAPSLQDRLQNVNADLKIGDVGPNVSAVHDYLAAYGYYPNADLATHLRAWPPLIANDPRDRYVFDQQTADAVRELQANYGLSPTGI